MQRDGGMEEATREALAALGGVFLVIKPGSSRDTGAGAYVVFTHHVVEGRDRGTRCWACVSWLGFSLDLNLPFPESPVQPCGSLS